MVETGVGGEDKLKVAQCVKFAMSTVTREGVGVSVPTVGS